MSLIIKLISGCVLLFLLGYGILAALTFYHPNEINFIGMTKYQVVSCLDASLKNGQFLIEIDGCSFYFKDTSSAMENPIVLNSNKWNVNYLYRCWGLYIYEQELSFEGNKVVKQKVICYSDGL